MKKKLIIILSILCLIIGVWIVKAKTDLFKLHKSPDTITQLKKDTTIRVKNKTVNRKKRTLDIEPNQDEDALTTYFPIDRVLLSVHNGTMRIGDITPTTARSSFGTPQSETTEFSEIDNTNVTVFKYESGEIAFIGEKLLSIELLDEGFSFIFVKADGTETTYTAGSDFAYEGELYNMFTSSFENELNNNITVFLTSRSGVHTDANLVFTLVDPYIIHKITLNN